MKKFLWLFILFIPFLVKADGINNYNINATVLENGDLYVQEVFDLDGTYNGFERIINFKNSSAQAFDGSIDAFNGSDIYNGTGIILKQIRAVDKNELDFNSLKTSGDEFKKVSYANKGDYGVYAEENNENGSSYLIYNPSSKRKAFYVEYVISNMAVVHNDVAEIGWNIFTSLNEDVRNLKITINIPNNQNELRAYAHGPLTGNIELINKNQFVLTLDELYPNEAMDTRFVFDKNIIVNPTKVTKEDALDKIISLETKKADEANLARDEAKKIEKERQVKILIVICFCAIYLIGLVFLVIRYYLKNDKELKPDFNQKYFRDIPSNYHPATVGYLFNKKVSSNDLSASILNLIDKKIIEVSGNDKKTYKFTYVLKDASLDEADRYLIKLLFGEKDEILLEDFKKNAKKNYTSFLDKYDAWVGIERVIAMDENFYDAKNNSLYVLYFVIGIILGCVSVTLTPFGFLVVLLSIIALIYISTCNKRTKKGNEEFVKWKALKNFMKDFSIIDKRELPEVSLWGKYLVYAVTLGCADTLAKSMKVRVQEIKDATYNNFDVTDVIVMNNFNRIINDSVVSALNSARSAKSIAESNYSSGGGFGGGFSGGGGSFGGGGGGGRF